MSPRRGKYPFEDAFADLPDDASSRLDALSEVNRSFRQALANQLKPVIRTLLQEKPPTDVDARKELVHRVNHVLRDANLAILDPETGNASTLVSEHYRMVLQGKKDQRNHRSNVKSLLPLELVEYTRQEPFLAWKDGVRRTDNPPGGQSP